MSTEQSTKSSANIDGMEALDLLRADRLLGLATLSGEQLALDEGKHTTLADRHTAEKLVKLFIVADGQLQMTGNDTRLLVVAGGVASQLENLGSEVLKDSGEVH